MKRILIFCLVLLMISTLFACTEKEPIKIGYSAGTSGPMSAIGVDARNAFSLGIKEINEAGGVQGRQLDLYLQDDGNDPSRIPGIYDFYRENEVAFVAGHIISGLAAAVMEEADKGDTLILSATMSTDQLNNRDDMILRTSPTNFLQSFKMAHHLMASEMNEIVVIFDGRNSQYTSEFIDNLSTYYEGTIVDVLAIGLSPEEDAAYAAKALLETSPQAVLMLTPAKATALIAQEISKAKANIRMFSVSWSMTNDLFSNGGQAVEGLELVYIPIYDERAEAKEAFLTKFQETYGYEPSTVAYTSYDLAYFLAKGLEEADDLKPSTVKQALLNLTYQGVAAKINLDETGDILQDFIIYQVHNGAFVPIP